MNRIFVAHSDALSDWASDVGLSKHVYKVGCIEGAADEALAEKWAGQSDWKIVAEADAGEASEADILERLGRREKMVDPTYYPKIRGARGIFKVAPGNVQNHLIVQRALAGEEVRAEPKLKAADFAAYLLANALR